MNNRGRPRDFEQDAIVDAAMRTFWRHGYEACSTQDLCQNTGLGKGSLYNTFGSKHNLFKQALERYHEIGIRQQLEILNRRSSARERLRNLLEWALAEDFEHPGKHGCLLINVSLERHEDPIVREIFGKHVRLLRDGLTKVMESGIAAGEISSNRSAEELTNSFLASYYGFRVLNASGINRDQSEKTLHAILASVFCA